MTDWHIEVGTEDPEVPAILLEEVARAVRWTLAHEEVQAVELSVALVNDAAIARLNREYLSHDRPTDVIAFPLESPGARLVGDVYIGLEQAERQSAELGIGLREELLRLAIHGTLHVLGWDHPEGDERAESPMFVRQETLLTAFLART